MRYESRHLFFAVVLNTVTPTTRRSRRSRHDALSCLSYSRPTTCAIMQGQEPDGLSLAALRTTLAAASQWAFAQSIFLTTANWSEQEKFLGLTKQQESC